jgi:hypothetical protein
MINVKAARAAAPYTALICTAVKDASDVIDHE